LCQIRCTVAGETPTRVAMEEKLIDVVGLYLNPPEAAVVMCVDDPHGNHQSKVRHTTRRLRRAAIDALFNSGTGGAEKSFMGTPWLRSPARARCPGRRGRGRRANARSRPERQRMRGVLLGQTAAEHQIDNILLLLREASNRRQRRRQGSLRVDTSDHLFLAAGRGLTHRQAQNRRPTPAK
jgi:hypothetical protein